MHIYPMLLSFPDFLQCTNYQPQKGEALLHMRGENPSKMVQNHL